MISAEHFRWLYTALVILAAAAEAGSPAPFPENAPEIHLKDQFRKRHDITFPMEKPFVIGIADQYSWQHAEAWYNAIKARYEDQVDLHGVAALDDFLFIWRPWLKWYLRHHLEEPILLDWKNTAADAYGYREKTLCIHVVAGDGHIIHSVTGAITEEKMQTLWECLDRLLETDEKPENSKVPAVEENTAAAEGEKKP